jgi:UPF0716 family protein affecting phage T7 exclusion
MTNLKAISLICFIVEIFSFIIVGYYLAKQMVVMMLVSLIIAMSIAVATGRMIEIEAVNKYKKGINLSKKQKKQENETL